MDDIPQNTLWIRFKNGNDQALSLIFDLYVNKLFSYGLKVYKDEQLVKDCIQEVFISLIDKRESLLISDKTHLYLFKSLRNKLFEEIRTSRRKKTIEESLKPNLYDYGKDAEEIIVRSEEEQRRKRILDRAIESLSIRQREILFLKYTEGLDYEAIAEVLGIDIASARTLIYRALKKIKAEIKHTPLLLFIILQR
jgi:RNA polymerase sigma factor (sigma-70 family)